MQLVIDEFITRRECARLRRLHDSHAVSNPGFYVKTYRTAHQEQLVSGASVTALEYLDGIRERIRTSLVEVAGIRRTIYPQFTDLVSIRRGGVFTAHGDNCQWNRERLQWELNGDYSRKYSAIVYLNDCGRDYSGGELAFFHTHFSDGQLHYERSRVVVPQAGRLVLFSSGPENIHATRPLRSGVRYSMAMWFCVNKIFSEPTSFAAIRAGGRAVATLRER